MPLNTPNLALKIYNSTTDASATFATYRGDQAGVSPTSNMNLIDSWVGSANASLLSLAQLGLHYVRGSYISANYYEATTTDISAYTTNMFISLSLSTDSDGAVGLNINSLGTKYLKRYDIDGNLIGFEVGELKKNRGYTFRYDGTYWVLVSSNLADQISASGINQHLIMISPCGVLIDSGISASSVGTVTGSYAPTSASYVVLALHPDLTNEWLLTAGNNITLVQDASASTITINAASGSSGSSTGVTNASYVVLSLNAELSNDWLLTAGSNISIDQDSSTSKVYINSTATSTSIISGSNLSAVVPIILGGTNATTNSDARANLQVAPSSGSYVVLALNSELKNEWLLTNGNNITLTQDNSASAIIINSSVSASSIAPVNANYLLSELDTNLPNGKKIIAGSGIILEENTNASTVLIEVNIVAGNEINIEKDTSSSTITISSNISASSIASSTASYIVLSLDQTLNNEWLLTAGSNITINQDSSTSTVIISSTAISSSIISGSNLSEAVPITLGGTNANNDLDARINLSIAPSTGSYVLFNSNSELSNGLTLTAGNNITLTKDSSASTLIVTAASGSSSGVTNASYVVLELNPDLSNDWLLTAGSGISIIKDNNASTIAIKNNFFVDQSGSSVKTYGLLSGSITGSNCDFTVSNQKFDSGTLLVYLNGQLQTQGSDDDWVETSASLGVFSFVRAPLAGDKIICHYMSKG